MVVVEELVVVVVWCAVTLGEVGRERGREGLGLGSGVCVCIFRSIMCVRVRVRH